FQVELEVFQDIAACASAIDKSHFVQMFDMGRSETFKYLVMEMVGMSLADLPSSGERPGHKHSRATIMHIARETLQAIEAFHNMGYIHRDIKPHNFAVGLPPCVQKVYLIDFGIARKYLDPDRRIRIPRAHVSFIGSPKYAPRAAHQNREQCRKDDLESWFFFIMEMFNANYLIWHAAKGRDDMCRYKDQFMTQPPPFK
ncbi:hypothetical protein PFISCL1PPCAC_13859, partial [Pristionchus fissidentatus]